MKILFITAGLVFTGLALPTHACTGDKQAASQSKASPQAAAKLTALAKANAAIAVPTGFTPMASKKAGSDVTMGYQIEGTPAVGQPLTIRLSMSSAQGADISFTTDSALALQNPSQVLKAAAGQPSQHSITVVPQALGRYYVNVFSNGQSSSSATSIAIQVGEPAQAKSKSADSSSAGASNAGTSNSGSVQQSVTGERTKTILVP